MWYCVVNVKNVEIKSSHHFCHLGCENEIVWRILEQRIRKDFDFMKKDAVGHVEPDGKSVTNEMDLVTARCELFSELGSDHAAATVARVTSDTDLHIPIT